MTGDKAVELINEWLNLAKEVGDMNLNRMEYDEERYNFAIYWLYKVSILVVLS